MEILCHKRGGENFGTKLENEMDECSSSARMYVANTFGFKHAMRITTGRVTEEYEDSMVFHGWCKFKSNYKQNRREREL